MNTIIQKDKNSYKYKSQSSKANIKSIMTALSFLLLLLSTASAQTHEQTNLSNKGWRTHLRKVLDHPTQNLSNGKYKGTLSSSNKRSGLGVYWWSSDYCYWGEWKKNDDYGYAIDIAAEGFDVNYCLNCSFYVGHYNNHVKNGKGTCYDKYGNLIYYGDFYNDSPSGTYPTKGNYSSYKFECIEYDSGDKYIGETKDGKRHGQGIYLWKNGDAWYGPWKNGVRKGYGILLYYSGDVKFGKWTNDTYEGGSHYSEWTNIIEEKNEESIIEEEQDPITQCNLGNKYYFGQGVPKDYNKAFYWYKKSAIQGNATAQSMLGYMYFNAEGTAKDVDASIYWNKKAADQNYWYSWSQLGHIYQQLGYYTESMFCYKKAAESPTEKSTRINAQYRLGCFYDYGIGVNKDLAEAKKWYKLSADEGYEYAINRLKQLGGYTDPEPNPNTTLAKLTWLSPTSETSQSNYELKVGVNSTSKIEDVTIYINDEAFRGINAVNNDGYNAMIEKKLPLEEGNNLIKVTVKNASGNSSIEKSIVRITNEIQPIGSERRIALVIGNSNYTGDNKLANPINDASDMANKLEKLGFYVIKSLNQTKQGMEASIVQFGQKAANYDVALFYYAGHGIRCEGINYLVPIDAELPDETSVKYNCTNANMVLDYMDKARCKMKIVILDACRNNPFERSWNRSMDGHGLSIMDAPMGTFIAFSTAPGNVALDGKPGQRNSPYTAVLLEMLDEPNVSLTDFFQEVLERVAQNTNDKQIPWTSNSFRGKFYFNKK